MSKRRQASLFNMVGFETLEGTSPSKRTKKSIDSTSSQIKSNEEVVDLNLDGKSNDEISRIKKANKAWCTKWGNEFEWLKFDKDLGRMFCTICQQQHKSRSEFAIRGSVNIQISAIKAHAACESHSVNAWAIARGKKTLEEGIRKQQGSVDSSVLNLFRVAYFIAKEDVAFIKYPAILSLLRLCNTPDVPRDIYQDDKSCALFVKYISEALKIITISRINSSKYFGLMIDESTDLSVDKHMVVYATFMEEHLPKICFLGLIDVFDESGQALHDLLVQMLSNYGLSLIDCISFGSDGASSMIGSQRGVATLLKKSCPFLTSIHCVAHRTNLCIVNAIKNNAYAQYVDTVVNDVSHIFSRSSKRTILLRSLEEEFDCNKYKLQSIHSIRWLSRHKVLYSFCEVLEPLLVYLKTENHNMFLKVGNFKFIYCVHFLADILEYMATLSQVFQRDYVDITSIPGLILSEVATINLEFIDDPMIDMNSNSLDSQNYPILPDYGSSNGYLAALRSALKGKSYRSVDICRDINGSDLSEAIEFQKEFSKSIVKNIEKRFKDTSILASLRILSPSAFPSGNYYELKTFGEIDVDKLLEFYGRPKSLHDGEVIPPLIEDLAFRKEFARFKTQASSEWRSKSLKDTWTYIGCSETLSQKFPNLLKLAQVALLQCCNTTICERGFSIKNCIKDKLRNSLVTKTVDALMRVSIEGPPMELVDLSQSIELWKNDTMTTRHIYT